MGYSHYWSIATDIPFGVMKNVASDMKSIYALAKSSGILLGDGFGEGNPIATNCQVNFNGSCLDNSDYEGFAIYVNDGAIAERSCKTGERPYDCVVTAALLLLYHEFENYVGIWSDGSPDKWLDGQRLVLRATGKDLAIPKLVKRVFVPSSKSLLQEKFETLSKAS